VRPRWRRVERPRAPSAADLQRFEDLLGVELERLGDLGDRRSAAGRLGAELDELVGPQRALVEAARNMDGPRAVAEMALDLAQHRRDGERREADAAIGGEAVERLDETQARDLEEVVVGLTRVGVAAGDAVRQRQKLLGQRLARRR